MDIETAYRLLFTDYKDILNLNELCEVLEVSDKTAKKMLQDGKIGYRKSGREYRIPKINVISYYLGKENMN